MERFTKIAVLVWTCAAIGLELWVLSGSWPKLFTGALILAGVMAIAAAVTPGAIALVLLASYVVPVATRLWVGGPHYAPQEVIWMAALAGAMLPASIRSGWHIPAPWRATLVTAAMVIVVATPIVILREIDLNPGLLIDRSEWYWRGDTWPSIVVTWSLHTALTLVIGVLWFDWLCGARDLDLHQFVYTPLVMSGLVLALVCVYQLFFDIAYLNQSVFAVIGRASGTMDDANVSGAVAALWIGGSFLWARQLRFESGALTLLLVLINWLAVWASGSRTAFAAALLTTAGISVAVYQRQKWLRARPALIAGIAASVLFAILVLPTLVPSIGGPLHRLRDALPNASPRALAVELWNRNGYGTAATEMARQFPLFGVGVGMYHSMARDYLPGLSPDNAQNWLRQQVVELGFIGAAPWLLWFVLFGLFVVRVRRSDPPSAWVTRAALVGFAAVSMLGIPGQSVMVAVTFWTLAFWHVSMVGFPLERPVPRWVWSTAALVVVAVAAGTLQLSLTRLRVPVRAQQAHAGYSYGFAPPYASGLVEGYRITHQHAVAVLESPHRWMSVSVRLNDEAVGEPVEVRVWTGGETLIKGWLDSTAPLTAVVELPKDTHHPILEVGARAAGSRFPMFVRRNESPLLLKWEFLERPPARITGYSHGTPS